VNLDNTTGKVHIKDLKSYSVTVSGFDQILVVIEIIVQGSISSSRDDFSCFSDSIFCEMGLAA